jgi:hypothetical protein
MHATREPSTDAYQTDKESHTEKNQVFVGSRQTLMFFVFFLTRGASLSMHRRQRDMHVFGSVCA